MTSLMRSVEKLVMRCHYLHKRSAPYIRRGLRDSCFRVGGAFPEIRMAGQAVVLCNNVNSGVSASKCRSINSPPMHYNDH